MDGNVLLSDLERDAKGGFDVTFRPAEESFPLIGDLLIPLIPRGTVVASSRELLNPAKINEPSKSPFPPPLLPLLMVLLLLLELVEWQRRRLILAFLNGDD